ncbi:MAG: CHAT domain-containing protein [Planctomycetota bacterium]
MLYYISLNKSRMILEDRLRTALKGGNIFSINNTLLYINANTGLPDKSHFYQKLKAADNYLDFYVEGSYKTVSVGYEDLKKSFVESASSFSSTRSVLLKERSRAVATADIFESDSLYVTFINNGKVTVIKKTKQQADTIRSGLDMVYELISLRDTEKRNIGLKNKTNMNQATLSNIHGLLKELMPDNLPEELVISPDGWISKYPLSYLTCIKVTRSLNLLTYGKSFSLDQIRLVGYFNPTLDLPDSEKEMEMIKPILPNSVFFKRESATLETLSKDIPRNILHLSMHGYNNPDEPMYSKLFFANSLLNVAKNDLFALYAKDMDKIVQMKNNDLVFTAACETGITKKSETNQSEILGILRPLLINNNKNIILTLWEVESVSAAEFVGYFYSRLAASKDIKNAFFYAQRRLKEKYNDPYYWAPYYLVQNNMEEH